MKALLICSLLINLAFAKNTITSSIVDIETSSNSPNVFHLYLDSGEILHSNDLLQSRKILFKENQLFTFEFDSDHKLLSASPIVKEEEIATRELKINDEEYIPSRLTEDQLKENFKFFRKGARSFSQCFNRAHVWAYESMKTLNIHSMKVFLFFTKKFIRENNFKWWFHVAPANYLQSSSQNELFVLDPYFTSKPLPLHEWSKLFVSKNIHCLEARVFSDYELNQEKESCLIIKSSMYYLQPKDLKALEVRKEYKKTWLKGEIERAYRNGFGILRKKFTQEEETRNDNSPN